MNVPDRKPHLFTPPKKGVQTLTKNGLDGWTINTFDGNQWISRNAPNMEGARKLLCI